jgi:hypothetical protein
MVARRDAREGAPARLAGVAAVVLFHGCVALALLSNPAQRGGPDAAEQVVVVDFIEKAKEAAPPPASADARHRRRRPAPARVADGAPAPAPALPSRRAAEDAVDTGHPLQLDLPATAIRIPDDPLRRADRDALDRPERIHFAIADRSLAGTLQRMAQARACGELRSALRRSPNSEAAIRKSMERYRCDG